MIKLEKRVVLTDSENNEVICTPKDLKNLLAVALSVVWFYNNAYKPYDLFIDNNGTLGVPLEDDHFYLAFEDAEGLVKLLEVELND